MFKFDTQAKVLEVSKIPIATPPVGYGDSESYLSYMQYVNKGLIEDIRDLLVPYLNNILGGKDDIPVIWFENCKVMSDKTSNFMGHATNSAMVRLGSPMFPNGTKKPFCAFRLPVMDRFGILHRAENNYALINELVQDDDITYKFNDMGAKPGDNELKVIMAKNSFIIKETATGKLETKLRGQKISVPDLILAMAIEEGHDPREIYDLFSNVRLGNFYKDEFQFGVSAELVTSSIKAKVQLLMTDPSYSVAIVRDKLNEVLSIDRALGRLLSRPVTLSSGQILSEETLITSQVLKTLKLNKINELYVIDIPNMAGWYLAKEVRVPYLRKGTEMLDCVRDVVADVKGNYLDRNVDLLKQDNVIIIDAGTQVDSNLLEMLAYNFIPEVVLKEKESSNLETSFKTVRFEQEIIGNRHFKYSDFGQTDKDTWCYVGESGDIHSKKEFLTLWDMVAMASLMVRLNQGKDHHVISDKDLGLRKKVNQANELFHQAFEAVYKQAAGVMKNKLQAVVNDGGMALDCPDDMENIFWVLDEFWWKHLYKKMRVISKLETVNPIALNSSINRIVTIVKDAKAIASGMRHLSMGHYGRLCPYETPQSKKLGLTNTKALGCKIVDGKMLTSYFVVKHAGKKSYLTNETKWLTVEEEEKYRIGDLTSLVLGAGTMEITNTERVFARIPSSDGLEKMEATYVDISQLDLVNTSPNQQLSVTASTIPFEGSDDPTRVSFGLNMCRQAKGLLNPEVPHVMTSAFRNVLRMNTYYQINAEEDGIVQEATQSCVVVLYNSGRVVAYDFKATEFGTETVIIRACEVKDNQHVKAGDVLVSSNFSKDGYLVMGVNALVGFCPVGFNYEDGVFASSRLRLKMTSYSYNSESAPINAKAIGATHQALDKFRYVKPGMTAYRVKYKGEGGRVVEKSIKSDRLKGFMVNIDKDVDKFTKREKSWVGTSISFDMLLAGDKIANRHGNKGVIPKLEKNANMPILKNGEFLDIVYNQHGVISRMNIGQVLEVNMSLAAMVLGVRIMSDSYNGASKEDVALLLRFAYELANSSNFESVLGKYQATFPSNLILHCREHKEHILSWCGVFDETGNAVLINPRTGKEYETPILIGSNYTYKLIHMSEKKLNARGGLCTEPYAEKFDAPTTGASNRGGQRYGTMEIDALSAYGASALIAEKMNECGDNSVRRNNLTVGALHKGTNYMVDEKLAIRRSTEAFVHYCAGLGIHVEFEDCGIPNQTKSEIEARYSYRVKALTTAKDVGGRVLKQSLEDFSAELEGR